MNSREIRIQEIELKIKKLTIELEHQRGLLALEEEKTLLQETKANVDAQIRALESGA
jgi:hypothetical protein